MLFTIVLKMVKIISKRCTVNNCWLHIQSEFCYQNILIRMLTQSFLMLRPPDDCSTR